MKVSVKKAKDCKVQMSVEVDPQTVESRYLEVLRDFQRQARLPGFREGKAPADMIEKRFADQAREELIKSLIPEIYHQSVQTQKVAPVSLPKISGIQYARGQKLIFSAEFDEAPVVSIKNYKGIKLKRESAEVTGDDMEKAIEQLLKSRGGEKLPEMNDEFAKTLGLDSAAALREALRKDISSYKHARSLEKMKGELFEKLLSTTSFPLPESLVEKQKERLISDTRNQYDRAGLTDAEWQEVLVKAQEEASTRSKDQVKLYFILQKISESETIEPDETEIAKRLQAMADRSERPLEEVRRVFEDDLRDSMREKKTVDFLIANAQFDESVK